MMKKCLLVGLVVLLIITFASVGFVAAMDATFYPALTIAHKGRVWTVDTTDGAGGLMFSGKDVKVKSIIATYYLDTAPEVPITIVPKDIDVCKNHITLTFAAKDLPRSGTVLASNVQGTLKNGDTFLASGPGWTWGNIR
jgi:hypothetical protein